MSFCNTHSSSRGEAKNLVSNSSDANGAGKKNPTPRQAGATEAAPARPPGRCRPPSRPRSAISWAAASSFPLVAAGKGQGRCPPPSLVAPVLPTNRARPPPNRPLMHDAEPRESPNRPPSSSSAPPSSAASSGF
jgi:hypothetical protein